MIISHSRRFIFIHIHKTAGESITTALAPHLARGDLVLGGTQMGKLRNALYNRRHRLSKHTGSNGVRRFVGEDVWASYFKFAIVRHPYDRALSLYHYYGKMLTARQAGGPRSLTYRLPGFAQRDPMNWPAMAAYLESDSFSEFIRHQAFSTNELGARNQVDLLSDRAGHIQMDQVGRFETLEADFATIAARIGVPQAELGWRNPSHNSQGPTTSLPPADADLLFDLYTRDFKAFGYRKDT